MFFNKKLYYLEKGLIQISITEKKLYNVTETSKLLGIGKAKVYELINSKHLKALDLGGLKVPSTEIDNFIENYTGYSFKNHENPINMEMIHAN